MNTPQIHLSPVKSQIAASCTVLGAFLLLSACNWVDSTGKQKGTISPGAQDPAVLGSPPENFDSAQVRIFSLIENGSTEIVPSIKLNSSDSDWTWGAPYQTGALPACNVVDGFETSLTAATLREACSNPDDCDIKFEYYRSDADLVSYDVTLPALRAPIGLAYALTATDSDDLAITEFLTLCAVSINEAPSARNDIFDVRAGSVLTVNHTDPVNLLSNDLDDIDVRNQELKVVQVAASQPELAEKFTLFQDGGFIYQPRSDLNFSSSSLLLDRFNYTVTDGQHESTASVTLRIQSAISETNSPPVIYAIDNEVIGVGDTFEIDIDAEDADEDLLVFSLSADSPNFVDIDAATGTMTGKSNKPGSYTITVIANDGTATTSLSFMLFVQASNNRPPFADDIQNKTVSGNFAYKVSVFFGDADGDPITFSATGIPADTQISTDGVISGNATEDNRGRHIIRVFASDGRGGIASDGFRLTIN